MPGFTSDFKSSKVEYFFSLLIIKWFVCTLPSRSFLALSTGKLIRYRLVLLPADNTSSKSAGVKMAAVLKRSSTNKSLSPVTKKSALEKSIKSNKKLSLGSRFTKCVGFVSTFSATVSKRSSNSIHFVEENIFSTVHDLLLP